MRLKSAAFLGAVLCVGMMSGCGSGSKSSPPPPPDTHTSVRYRISDLGLTIGPDDVVVLDINNAGQVASLTSTEEMVPCAPPIGDPPIPGSSADTTEPRAIGRIHASGAATELPTRFDHSYHDVVRISDAGLAVGTSHTPGECWSGVAIDHGSVRRLAPLAGDVCSHAMAVNGLGHVVGWSSDREAMHACLWSDGKPTGLGTLDGASRTRVIDINDNDDVTGYAWSNGPVRSFLGHGDRATDIGRLAGSGSCYAESMNNSQQIVGWCDFYSPNTSKAFTWRDGRMSALGTLGGTSSSACCINNLGQVVGWATAIDGKQHAFLWQNGHMFDLNSLIPSDSGWVLTSASVINDSGVIVGLGTYHGASRAYILTPAE